MFKKVWSVSFEKNKRKNTFDKKAREKTFSFV